MIKRIKQFKVLVDEVDDVVIVSTFPVPERILEEGHTLHAKYALESRTFRRMSNDDRAAWVASTARNCIEQILNQEISDAEL